MKPPTLILLAVVLLGSPQAFLAQSGSGFESLSSSRVLGGIAMPVGTVLWRSSVSNWSGAVLGAQTQYKGTVLDVGTLLVFDESGKLRIIHPRMKQGNAPWRLFDAGGTELTLPQGSGVQVPRERQPRFDLEMGSGPLSLAAEIRTKTLSLSRPPGGWPSQTADVQAAVVAGTGFTVDPVLVPPDTFVETYLLNDDGSRWVSEFVLLNDAAIRGITLPKGSIFRLAMVGTAEQPFARLVSKSPTSLPVFEANAPASDVIGWSGELTPQTYSIATPIPVGTATLPAGTWVFRSENDIIVKPSERVSIAGVPIGPQSYSRIRNGQVTDTWLVAEWEYAPRHALPEGTRVIFRNGRLSHAGLLRPLTVDGLSLVGTVWFSADGKVKAGRLNAPASLDGVECGPGGFSVHPSGALEQCELAHAQTVKGVRLRADRVVITPSGNIVTGILDQDLRVGIRTLRPGDRLSTLADERATLEVLDAEGVNDLEAQVKALIEQSIPKALVSMKSSVSVLGKFEAADVHLDSQTRVRQEHGILFPSRYSVRNLLKNPPFADCDCRVNLVPEFGWKVDPQGNEVVVFTRLQPNSLITIETNICPTTAFALLLNRFASIFGPQIQTPEQVVTSQKFNDKVINNISTFIRLSNPGVEIIPSQTRIEDIRLVDGVIRVTAQYSRVIK